MPSVKEEIIERRENGHYSAQLTKHCLDWKQHPSRYAVGNVVRIAVEGHHTNELYEVLLDKRFHSLRQSQFGVNELRADLEAGRRYFSSVRPDLLRYMQIVFLEQGSGGNPDVFRMHETHCQRFADFLQLDRLPNERRDEGLHRALGRFFPVKSTWRPSRGGKTGERQQVTLRLAGYELGKWRCSCGRLIGFLERYRFSCICGTVRGIGRLATTPTACRYCNQVPTYLKCSECSTRVTLDIIWQMLCGGAHPSIYQIPLTLNLLIERPGADDTYIDFALMYLPIMLGLREREGSLIFEIPDIFWVKGNSRTDFAPYSSGSFISMNDFPRYDKQTDVCKIFEAVFRRTLWRDRGGYQTFRNELVEHLTSHNCDGSCLNRRFTRNFELRLSDRLGSPERRPGELFQFAEVSQVCVVAASPLLRNKMAVVNRRLASPAALSAPRLVKITAALNHDDALTPEPPNTDPSRTSHLDQSGIATPGSMVTPGDILIGVSSPITSDEITPEERLLRALFGELINPPRRNNSLVMTGEQAAWILSQDISVYAGWEGREISAIPGRFIDQHGGLRPTGPYITITLAVDQPLGTGETLVGEDDSKVVVCGLLEGESLRRVAGTKIHPDVLVAVNHPWAPSTGTTRVMRIRLDTSTLTGSEIMSHAAGTYAIVSQQPWVGDGLEESAQLLTAADFDWIIDRGARRLALEIYGPRADCVDWRSLLRKSLIDGRAELTDMRPTALKEWATLQDSPSEAIRNWNLLLRSARISPNLRNGKIVLEPMTDQDVIACSFGEVKVSATYDWRIKRPTADGLLSERIFGPEKDWQCACGRYSGRRHEGTICEDCFVEVADHRVRRRRMGHIVLAAPVLHPWYTNGPSRSRLAELLDMSSADLNRIIKSFDHVVTSSGSTSLRVGQRLSYSALSEIERNHPRSGMRSATGVDAIEILLKLAGQPSDITAKSGSIIIRKLPVLPAGLRPQVRFGPGYPVTSDLTDLYSTVISTNNMLAKELSNHPDEASRWLRNRLQDSVNALFDNMRCEEPTQDRPQDTGGGRILLSVADAIQSPGARTTGSLRDTFLSRPIDYSARTRLVCGDTPSLDTALLPIQLAWNLFLPILIHKLCEAGASDSIISATKNIEERTQHAHSILELICAQSLVLVSVPTGPWPLIALRVHVTPELALRVRPELLDLIGWDNLGERAGIFSIFTTEAVRDAVKHLTPTCLQGKNKPQGQNVPNPRSIFDINQEELVGELSWATLTGQPFLISGSDYLILCSADWLSGGFLKEDNDDPPVH
jgi:hypothetical protein